MHVFWFCRSKISCHAWSDSLLDHITTSLSDSLGIAWLLDSRYASWNRRHPAESLPIAQIRRSGDSNHSSEIVLYRCHQGNWDVSGPKSAYCWHCLEYVLLRVWKVWAQGLDIWSRVHTDAYRAVRHWGISFDIQNTAQIPLRSEISKYSDNGTPITLVVPP